MERFPPVHTQYTFTEAWEYSWKLSNVPGMALTALNTLAHFITTLWSMNYQWPHFTDEEMHTKRLGNMPRFHNWKAMFWITVLLVDPPAVMGEVTPTLSGTRCDDLKGA